MNQDNVQHAFSDDVLGEHDAVELAKLIENGELSSAEIVEAGQQRAAIGQAAVELYLAEVASGRLSAGGWRGREMFERWAQDDPLAAIAGAMRIREALDRNRPLKHVIEGWAKFDGAAAAGWLVAEVRDGKVDDDAYEFLFSGWGVKHTGELVAERLGRRDPRSVARTPRTGGHA